MVMDATIVQRLEAIPDRVRDHSAHAVNRRIEQRMEADVDHVIRQGRDAIVRRLAELDREWDIDRVLMANFAVAGGVSYGAGLWRSRGRRAQAEPSNWLYLVAAQFGFLLLHATVGWCPPAALWRRLGARTKSEIEVERALLLQALEPKLTGAELLSPPASHQVAS